MRRADGRGLVFLPALAALLGIPTPGCRPGSPARGGAVFADVTAELGLPGPDPTWPDGTYFLPEITQGGVGLFDADADGILDLLHVRIPPPGGPETVIANRMYRRAREDQPFADVTAAAGLGAPGFGQGLAVGDTENDGDLDLLVANYGPDAFYVNHGDGRFEDATERAGIVEDGWSIAAAFCDYDADGFQDLYVVHYQRFDPGKECTDSSGRREYCGPINGAPDLLFRNLGDGTFADRTKEAGIVLPQRSVRATGLGVAFLDLTQDGRPDIFVANDAQANQLWVNQGDGTFVDQGIQRGVAFDRDGRAEANMGIAVGDVSGDGALDLFVTHLWQENNRLYLGTRLPVYRDFTIESGLSSHDLERTGFGCGFFDFDHDGDQDLAVVNGAVKRRPPLSGARSGFWADYAEPNQLFENEGGARFTLAEAKAGPFAAAVEVSRALAFGDLDSDGDLDLVVSNVDNSLQAYRNDAPRSGHHWLMVRALTKGRDALGAQIRVQAGGRELIGLALASYSYGSSCDPRAHFGLGARARVERIDVLWPDGQTESFPGTDADRVLTLRQGEGRSP
jgi:hypothetical protein